MFSAQEVRLHFKRLKWHCKSFTKRYCQKFNFPCSCEAEESSWKLTDLFFAWFIQRAAPAISTPQTRELWDASRLFQGHKDGAQSFPLAARAFGGQFPLTECYWKASIMNAARKEYGMWQNAQDSASDARGGCTSSRRGNETQTSHPQADAAVGLKKNIIASSSSTIFVNPDLFFETNTWKPNTSLTKWADLHMLNKSNNLGFLWKIEPIFKTPYQNQTPLPLQFFSLEAEPVFT